MSNMNIKPNFWGPKLWGAIFSIVAVYPEIPNVEYINSTKGFFTSLTNLLPCNKCKLSYNEYIKESDTNLNDNTNFSSRKNLIKFVYLLREKVNTKLGLEYCLTVEYFEYKLNKMICVSENKVDSYVNYLNEAPFIPKIFENTICNFVYINKQHIQNYNLKYTKLIIMKLKDFIKKPDFNINNPKFKLWLKRNNSCRLVINIIYSNMSCGDYNMLESFRKDLLLHLKLFYMGCSIIPINDLKILF